MEKNISKSKPSFGILAKHLFHPPASKASREVANLTDEKTPTRPNTMSKIGLSRTFTSIISENYLHEGNLNEVNISDNHHFALIYLLGITRLMFTRSTAQEPSIYGNLDHLATTAGKGLS